MKLLLVSNFDDIPEEHYLLNLLFCEGLQYFHLRKANYSTQRMETYLEKIPPPFRQYVILHSHFDLVDKYQLRGAHFTKQYSYEDFLRSKEIEDSESPKPLFKQLGFSLHSIQEVKKMSSIFDYLFLSPIFDSISNRGYNSKFRINDLKVFLSNQTNRPEIIALGGITDQAIDKAFDLGFDGVALLGHIWTIFENDHNLIQAVKRFRFIQHLIEIRNLALIEESPRLTQN
ncbi:MAG: thiamine phosphate synthase [Bacteroidota bacterium]